MPLKIWKSACTKALRLLISYQILILINKEVQGKWKENLEFNQGFIPGNLSIVNLCDRMGKERRQQNLKYERIFHKNSPSF